VLDAFQRNLLKTYLQHEIVIVPVKLHFVNGKKHPEGLPSWQHLQTISFNEFVAKEFRRLNFNDATHVAVVLQPSHLVVLDFDETSRMPSDFVQNALEVAEKYRLVTVRTGRGLHIYFRRPADDRLRRLPSRIPVGDGFVEFKSAGLVFAPLYDPDDYYHPVRFFGEGNLVELTPEILKELNLSFETNNNNRPAEISGFPENHFHSRSLSYEQKQILKTLLLPYWSEGCRHDLALGLAGLLAKEGVSKDDAMDLLRQIADEAKDNEWRDRERALTDTFERLWRGETIVGYKRIEEVLEDKMAKVIAYVLRDEERETKNGSEEVPLLTVREWRERIEAIGNGEWLIEGLLQSSWLFILNARPKTGKSIVAVNLATSLAANEVFLGLKTNSCAVIYIDLERPLETARRFEVLGAIENPNIFVPSERLGADRLDILRKLIQIAKERTGRPVVVVVDTLADFIVPALRQKKASINDYDPIAEILQSIRNLAHETGCAFVFVHHTRKSQSEDPTEVDVLGSTAISGKFDVIAHLLPNKTEPSVLALSVEGNAIAKSVWHFSISDDFRLVLCDAPARSKEEKAAKEIQTYLQTHRRTSRKDLEQYLLEIGLADTHASAHKLLDRAMVLLRGEVVAVRDGRTVVYTLPDEMAGEQPQTERETCSERDELKPNPASVEEFSRLLVVDYSQHFPIQILYQLYLLYCRHKGMVGEPTLKSFVTKLKNTTKGQSANPRVLWRHQYNPFALILAKKLQISPPEQSHCYPLKPSEKLIQLLGLDLNDVDDEMMFEFPHGRDEDEENLRSTKIPRLQVCGNCGNKLKRTKHKDLVCETCNADIYFGEETFVMVDEDQIPEKCIVCGNPIDLNENVNCEHCGVRYDVRFHFPF